MQLTEQCLHTPWQQKVFTKLLGLQYTIRYRKGPENKVADALSHFLEPGAQCVAISTTSPAWTQLVAESYLKDPLAQDMLTKLAFDSIAVLTSVFEMGCCGTRAGSGLVMTLLFTSSYLLLCTPVRLRAIQAFR